MSLYSIFTQQEIDIIFKGLELYRNRCKQNCTRPIQGFGKATELEKRQSWREKQQEVEALETKFSQNLD